MRDFLIHTADDNVGVVVRDVKAGEELTGETIDRGTKVKLRARQDIPLGHKIALKDLKTGDTAVKYGADIGRVVAEIRAGEHVHVHNLKTKRW